MGFGEWLAARAARAAGAGLWEHLNVRVRARAAVELERERNRGALAEIRALPHGAKFFESEPAGRTRVIVMPEAPPKPQFTVLTVEAGPAPLPLLPAAAPPPVIRVARPADEPTA